MTPSRRRSTAILTALSTVVATLGLLLAGAPPATAAISTGHGVGHLAGDGVAWIGSYRLDDASLVFCLEAGKKAPTGHDYSFVDAASLGRFSPDDLARLAYISRSSAASSDATEAAAGQLATWRIAGLNGQTPQHYADRAGASAQAVLDRSNQLLANADGAFGASRSVSSTVELTAGDGSGELTVTTSLTVDFLATGPVTLPAASHEGTITLTGAVFDDGTTERRVGNAEIESIIPLSDAPSSEVAASVTFSRLPYGSAFTAGLAAADVQQVLVARPGSATGAASTVVTVPSHKSFQPIVQTQTSSKTTQAGAAISDELIVTARVDNLTTAQLAEWGVYRPSTPPPAGTVPAVDANGMLPVPVVIESSLLGPFVDPIEPSVQTPVGAPVVCTVEVLADAGPGRYRTPECILPGAGYYVWVERIMPGRTSLEHGGARILPWQSSFGTASEVTFVAPPLVEVPPVVPEVPTVVPAAPPVPDVLADTGNADAPALLSLSCTAILLGTVLAIGVLWRRRRADSRLCQSTH